MRGGAPGSREINVMDPFGNVDQIDAICLSGGSAYGLDAASGVMDWLRGQGRGFSVGPHTVPLVPAAILFDLANGGDKDWAEPPPYRDLGHRAVAAASADFTLGNAGAGYGAMAGKIKGGLGSASLVADDGLQVGAVVAANPVGSVVMPGSATLWAWSFERNGELGGQPAPEALGDLDFDLPLESRIGGHTTLAVVATNLALDKVQAGRLAIMAQDGFARAIRPVHTPFDGDTVFALSTDKMPLDGDAGLPVARAGMMAADCVARAVARAVYEAESLGGAPSYRSLFAGRLAGMV
jgi:L-aminopeptidase/D-esterase-like protein